jgi:hypothetical protein
MKLNILYAVLLLLISGCAGLPLPFTEYRLAEFLVESDRTEINNSCTDLETLNRLALTLEAQHLSYIQTQDESNAIEVSSVRDALGEACENGIRNLSTPQIKTELFGDVQTINDSSKLRELGGLSFEFRSTIMHSGIEISLHLDRYTKGPKRLLVAIYKLSDGKVIHFNYSGIDDVDRYTRFWPIREFFGLVLKGGTKAVGAF